MDNKTIDELLYVERLHARHFREWAESAQDPLSKVIFTIAADKEENHVKWVKMMAGLRELDDKVPLGGGLDLRELEFWIADEEGEGDSYERIARKAGSPVVEHVLRHMASDESSNAKMISELVSLMAKRV